MDFKTLIEEFKKENYTKEEIAEQIVEYKKIQDGIEADLDKTPEDANLRNQLNNVKEYIIALKFIE